MNFFFFMKNMLGSIGALEAVTFPSYVRFGGIGPQPWAGYFFLAKHEFTSWAFSSSKVTHTDKCAAFLAISFPSCRQFFSHMHIHLPSQRGPFLSPRQFLVALPSIQWQTVISADKYGVYYGHWCTSHLEQSSTASQLPGVATWAPTFPRVALSLNL